MIESTNHKHRQPFGFRLSALGLGVFLWGAGWGGGEPLRAEGTVSFERDIRPILVDRCLRCHGAKTQKNGLRLDRRRDALRGGDSGAVIQPGSREKSRLYRLVAGLEEKIVMPAKGRRLDKDQVELIGTWIDEGAHWPKEASDRAADTRLDFWSLKPLRRPDIPRTFTEVTRGWIRNPIDAFVAATLEKKGLRPSPAAGRRTLIRRLYFDLLGLPPSPEEVDAFVADPDPEAYERLVDRLLASPRYGERWARHWLDVVHYGDTHGYDKDKPRPNAWPYRDYVIRAWNADKPYGRFVQEQLAGDVLYPGTLDGIVATGFIAAGPWDLIGHAEVSEDKVDGQVARNLDRDDMVTCTMNTFVSLTVQCARCHEHKFDPVTMEDYYSLQSVFAALDRADREFDLDPKVGAARARLREEIGRLEVLRKQATAEGTPEEVSERIEELEKRLASVRRDLAALPKPMKVYAGMVHTGRGAFRGTGHNGGKPRPIYVLRRGDIRSRGKKVSPGTVDIIPGRGSRFELPQDYQEGAGRAALARWIARRDNPLTWRSIVNRIWQYHFGRALVDSPNDFGRMGARPTHPALLDWLAVEFRDGGQSWKRLHRLILTSATYRQSSQADAQKAAVDGSNRWLWRMNRRRLEAEAIRDTVLMLSGQLDETMYGPGFQDFVIEKPEHSPHYQYSLYDPRDPRTHRRSVYRFLVRSQQQPFMTALDCADPSMMVAKRDETLTPLQALALLNDRFMITMASEMARRMAHWKGSIASRMDRAFYQALGRRPDAKERADLTAFAAQYGLANACRALFNLNEFLFVD